jgi:hypothetical protein
MYRIPGTETWIPGTVVSHHETREQNAWLGAYCTVELTSDLEAIRVHVGAGEGGVETGARLHGRWFGVGDFVQTYDEYRQSRALPAHFTHIAMATLLAGTVVNVGRCSPLPEYGVAGGGEQVEVVSGPPPILRPLDATWSRTAGHA